MKIGLITVMVALFGTGDLPQRPLPSEPINPASIDVSIKRSQVDSSNDHAFQSSQAQIDGAVNFLLTHQNPNGSWGSAAHAELCTWAAVRALAASQPTPCQFQNGSNDDSASEVTAFGSVTARVQGTPSAGLYAHLAEVSAVLSAMNTSTLYDSNGCYDWRIRLIDDLQQSQQRNGSWPVAAVDRTSDDEVFAASNAIIALRNASDDLRRHPAR